MDSSSPIATTVPDSNWTSQNESAVQIDQITIDLSLVVFCIAIVTSIISIISSIILIYTFQRYLDTNDVQNNLIKCLTLSNGLTCVGIVLGTLHYEKDIPFGNSGDFCVVQSAICTYFDMLADVFTLCVIVNHCSVTAFNSNWMKRRSAVICYVGFAVCTPAAIVVVALWWNALGEAKSQFGSWCWINDSLSPRDEWIWMVVTKQGWELVVYLGTAFVFLIILFNHRRVVRHSATINGRVEETTGPGGQENAGSANNSILVWIGVYFYLAKVWGTVRYGVRITKLALHLDIPGFIDVDRYFFIHMQSFGDSFQATITCIIFVFCDSELRQKLCRRSRITDQAEQDNQTPHP